MFPGWHIILLLSAQVRCQGAAGSGQGGAPSCVAQEGTTGGGGEGLGAGGTCAPPGARSQVAVMATVLITSVQGSVVPWSAVIEQEGRPTHWAATVAWKPARSQEPRAKAPQEAVEGVPYAAKVIALMLPAAGAQASATVMESRAVATPQNGFV